MGGKTLCLRPNITFERGNIPDNATIDVMYHRSHQRCFIAKSGLNEVIIGPAY
jgi:hypothetical protein